VEWGGGLSVEGVEGEWKEVEPGGVDWGWGWRSFGGVGPDTWKGDTVVTRPRHVRGGSVGDHGGGGGGEGVAAAGWGGPLERGQVAVVNHPEP